MERPEISFIIPAYNAANTLAACIESLNAQTVTSWEAVIVDDGSKDATLETAQALAAKDARIKVIHQDNAGASAARNKGAENASAPYMTMLDSDDWIDASFIEIMLPLAKANANTIPYCDYQDAVDQNQLLDIGAVRDLAGDKGKLLLADHCEPAIHCCVVPTQTYLNFNGMDTELATCEDWDLWMRMIFGGVKFLRVQKVLSFYRRHPGTLSGNPYSILRDGIKVMGRARKLVADTFGADSDEVNKHDDREINFAIWYISMFARKGVDIERMLSFVPLIPDLTEKADSVGQTIAEGLTAHENAADVEGIITQRHLWVPVIEQVLDILEARSLPGLKRRAWMQVARRLEWRLTMLKEPIQLGNVLLAPVDIKAPKTIAKPDSADVALVALRRNGKRCGVWEVPLFTDFSVEDQLRVMERNIHPRTWRWIWDSRVYRPFARALISRKRRLAQLSKNKGLFSRELLRFLNEVLEGMPAPKTEGTNTMAMHAIAAEERALLTDGTNSKGKEQLSEDNISGVDSDSPEYWDQVFQAEDPWDYLSVYETKKYEQTLDLLPDQPIRKALEVACAEGVFTTRLADRVEFLKAVDISETAVTRAQKRCSDKTNIEFGLLDLTRDTPAPGQDLIICSEVLYYLKDEAQLTMVAKKFADALVPGGYFMTAHAFLRADNPQHTGFDWGNPFGIDTIRKVFSATRGLALEEVLETELYQVLRFRKLKPDEKAPTPIQRSADYGKPLTSSVANYVVWQDTVQPDASLELDKNTKRVPVLMYHRVAEDGPAELADYRVTEAQFEAQMQYLKQQGFYTISSAQLERHMRRGIPFQGRPIIISFDDAYQDFFDVAMPILRKYAFKAELFVVSDKVGKTSDWDERFGAPAPLMDWPEIAEAREAGMYIGSHLATHQPASSLTSTEVLREAVRSRATIEKKIGGRVYALALPYGDYDHRLPSLMREAGYTVVFGTKPYTVDLHAYIMEVPRHNVGGGITIDKFAELVRHN